MSEDRYSVFISHSAEDAPIVWAISRQLESQEVNPIVAVEKRPDSFPQYLPEKIKKLINQSDCVIALLTQNGVDSNWVHQEVGYSLDNKPMIPIVDKYVSQEELAFLQGVEYISISLENISNSINKLISWIKYLKSEKEKEDILKVFGIIGGAIGAGLLWWWLSKED